MKYVHRKYEEVGDFKTCDSCCVSYREGDPIVEITYGLEPPVVETVCEDCFKEEHEDETEGK